MFAQNNKAEKVSGSELKETEQPISTDQKPVVKKKKLTSGEGVKAWKVNEAFATETVCEPDTASLNFERTTTPIYKETIAAEWLGNLGLPGQSAIFSQRHETSLVGDYIFRNPYLPYFKSTENITFYNTRVPYSNLSYYTGGYTNHGEDHLTGILSMNVNKRLNLGLDVNYIYGRGSFYNQSSDGLTGALNGSYRGERYSVYFIAGLNNFRNFENGGITNDADLKSITDSYNIPVRINNAWSVYKSFYIWVNQQYSIGFKKLDPDDSDKKTFVPVTTFGYTVKFEGSRKKYYEKSITANYYANNYYSDKTTRDTTSNNILRNILSVTLNEGFQKWAVFGVRAFAEADVEQNMCLIADSVYGYQSQCLVSVGGELFKRKGKTNYGVLGEVLLLGSKNRLAFNVSGDFNTEIPIKNEKLLISAVGHVKSTNPSHFTESYYSNHFIWENKFDNTWSARGYGNIAIPNKYCNFSIGAGWQGVKNYIYFGNDGTPKQSPDFIQIISGNVRCDVHVKWFNWENQATIQYSSNKDILPLPLVSIYSNLYFKWLVFKKILTLQVGVDCRYNTAYYANAYMPATGQFYLQNETLVGNYPLMNVYLNMHLKQFRVFLMYYNLSQVFMEPTYFAVPHYPLNPGMFKVGISWNFYN